jgi:hypothetical protein
MSLQIFTTISTRAELYNYSTINNERVIAAIGLSSAWDVPTEIWTFDSSSMAVDNGITVIKPTDILVGDPGRFLFRTYFIRQTGTKYSKEFKAMQTTSSNSVVFDISPAGFSSIVDFDCKAFLNGAGVTTAPIAIVTAKSTTSITVSLFQSKTTGVLIGGTIEGLETHAVVGTEVYLTVQGN